MLSNKRAGMNHEDISGNFLDLQRIAGLLAI